MAWNLKITPQGILYNQYYKNFSIYNPNSTKFVESSHFLSDYFSSNFQTNTVDLRLNLSLYDSNPLNVVPPPNIIGISEISISNDPNFQQVAVIVPDIFSNYYNSNTDYVYDLNTKNVSNLNLPTILNIKFSENSGGGTVVLKNWPLSDGAGSKKVFYKILVELSDGSIVGYPSGYGAYDEVLVFTNEVVSPEKPVVQSKVSVGSTSYTLLPALFSAYGASNSFTQYEDSGVASYFWDCLVLKNTSDIYRNNNSNVFSFFQNVGLANTQINTDLYSFVFTPINYTYTFAKTLPALKQSENISFLECKFSNNNLSYNSYNVNGFSYIFSASSNLTATIAISSGLEQAAVTLTIDGVLSKVFSYSNYKVIGKMIQGGTFLVIFECFDFVNNLIQFKILYSSLNSNQKHVICDCIFSSSSLINSSFNYAVSASWNGVSSQLVLEASQYGNCYGALSASILPTDKINTSGTVSNTQFDNFSNSWYVLSNSPYAAVVGLTSNSKNIKFVNNNYATNSNQLVVSEVQSNIPTFYENSSITINLNSNPGSQSGYRVGYSFDDNLNFNSFNFSNDLFSPNGILLPINAYSYSILSNLNWTDNTKNFVLNLSDSNTSEVCSINNYVTSNLIVSAGLDGSTNQTIKTKSSLSTSDTFSAWINTSGLNTSSVVNQSIVFTNTGNTNITISTSSISTISPNQSFVFSSLATQQVLASPIYVIGQTNAISKSVNFIFDCGSVCSSITASFNILLANPPNTITSLPSFQYSLETSNDFITFNYISDVTPQTSYNPSTGKINLKFILSSYSARYVRIRLYYNANATFDPRNNYSYSGFSLSYTSSNIAQSGKIIFGFTDTSAKSASLNSLYNQPTYLRTLQNSSVNNSKIISIGLDYSDYSATNFGPVYLSLITEKNESRIKVFESGFPTNPSVTLNVFRQPISTGYKISAGIGINSTYYSIDHLFYEEQNTNIVDFGYYPFVSLLGNGNFSISSAVGLAQSNPYLTTNQSFFSLFTANDPNDTPNFGKNLIYQNVYNPSNVNFPALNGYFSYNPNIYFDYTASTFTVKAVSTISLVLYGATILDAAYVANGDFVLVTGQSDKTQNGIYEVSDYQWNLVYPGTTSNILVSDGIIYNQTLWTLDAILNEWICNVIRTQFVLNDNSLLANAKSFILPNYFKIAIGLNSSINIDQNISSINQFKVKLVNSPSGNITGSDLSTQWQSLFSPSKFNNLQITGSSNHNQFVGVLFNTSQINTIKNNIFPTVLNVLVAYSGAYVPVYSANTQILMPNYGSPYRMFVLPQMCLQAFSTLSNLSYAQYNNNLPVTNIPVQTAVYAQNVANNISPQTEYSDAALISNSSPVLGALTVVKDNVKSVSLGLSTYPSSSLGVMCARTIQVNPIGEKIYGSWFGYQGIGSVSLSLVGFTSITAYPSAVVGIQTNSVEPLSGYYRYKLQVMDLLGNWAETNEVTNFYYENAIVDTQPPIASVSFVQSDYTTPLQVVSSSSANAQLNAYDYTTGVKAYQYLIGYSTSWSNWIDYKNYVNILFDDTLSDGNLTVQFRFKDFADNVMSQSPTAFTYAVVSRLLQNVVFTVMATLGNSLFIGGSKNGIAVLYLWINNTFTTISNSNLSSSKSISAIKTLSNGSIIIGTDKGYVFLYENNILAGPITQFAWGGQALPITKFHEHLFANDSATTILAGTMNIPRIFYVSLTQIQSSTWNVLQPANPYITSVNLSNTGLWSGNRIYYTLSTSYVNADISITKNYGISSGILVSGGSGYNFSNNSTTVKANGPISNFYASVIGQGGLIITPLSGYNGSGYDNSTTITIDPPPPGIGTVQAVFTPVLGANGSIVSYNPVAQGSGYTQVPKVTIIGVGTGAVPNVQVNYNSVWGINVVSPGLATTTNISLSIIGSGSGANIYPDFIYRVNGVAISNPGFGYTSNPIIYVNGISTVITASVSAGSVQSLGFNSSYYFSNSVPLAYSIVGGLSSNYSISFTTSSAQYYNNGVLSTGTIISNLSLLYPGNNLTNTPSISFASSLYNPEIVFGLSDGTLFNSQSGTIYDIKSFGSSIFVSSSQGGLIYINKQNGAFKVSKYSLNQYREDTSKIPFSLANYNNTVYFSIYNSDLIGYVFTDTSNQIFNDRNWNVLSYKPYNFDILSDWQLVKNPSGFSTGTAIGTSSASIGLGTYAGFLQIDSFNSQIYYDSTKTTNWLDRLNSFNELTSGTSVNYAVQLSVAPLKGTQAIEITTYLSILRINFVISDDQNNLTINLDSGNSNIQTLNIQNDISGNLVIEFVKSGADLFVYSNSGNLNTLVASLKSFYINSKNPNTPVFRFGEIFKVITRNNNSVITKYFGVPVNATTINSPIFNSTFIWKQIKFAFQNSEILFEPSTNINLYVPYNLNRSQPVQFLTNLNNTLYSVVKGSSYFNANTIPADNSVKIFSFSTSSNIFTDVTGNFEIYNTGLNSSYILSSAFDMASIGTSYFITGVTQNVNLNPNSSPYILLGLSSNYVYEEEDTYLTILYPNQINRNGTTLNLSSNNSLVNVPSTVFFGPTNLTQVLSLGIGSTSAQTSATISVTDGTNIGLATVNITPLSAYSFTISTSSCVTYSNSQILLNIALQKRTVSPRTINVTSTMPSVLYVPGGLATVYPYTSNTQVLLQMGVATATQGIATFSINYRNSLSTSIIVNPLILNASLSTNIFVAGATDNPAYLTGSVQSPVWTSLNISAIPTISGIFTTPNYNIVIGAGNTSVTSLLTPVGFATTSKIGVLNVSVPGSNIGLGFTALPFTFNTAVDNLSPVFPYQSPNVTYTLNNIPYSYLNIYNHVQQPVGVAATYPAYVTFATGETLQTFSISTTTSTVYSGGIAITAYGTLY